jgi:hypothetical protein
MTTPAMNYGDFSSIVQLGVGLHIGTALLQLYGELYEKPLVRSLERVRALAADTRMTLSEDHDEQITRLAGDFEIFRIQFFHAYRRYVYWNSGIAVGLTGVLIALAYSAQTPADPVLAFLAVAASILPLFALWTDASRKMNPILDRSLALERDLSQPRRPG